MAVVVEVREFVLSALNIEASLDYEDASRNPIESKDYAGTTILIVRSSTQSPGLPCDIESCRCWMAETRC